MTKFKIGDEAISRDGHPVRIVNISSEEGVEFAWVKYLDGYQPGPVGGRVAGDESDPIWEHRVKNGKVIRSGGDYYNPADWVVERGLSPSYAPLAQTIRDLNDESAV